MSFVLKSFVGAILVTTAEGIRMEEANSGDRTGVQPIFDNRPIRQQIVRGSDDNGGGADLAEGCFLCCDVVDQLLSQGDGGNRVGDVCLV